MRPVFTVCRALVCIAGLVSPFPAGPAAAVEGGGFEARPSLMMSEIYNDNLYLRTEDRLDGYITVMIPSLRLSYGSSRVKGELDYALDYRSYGRRTPGHETTHRVKFASQMNLLDGHFFLNLRDSYDRVSLNTARDYTQESLFVNQTDRNIFSVNPGFLLGPFGHSTMTLGYRYLNTWYKDIAAIDRYDHVGYADVTTGLSTKSTLTTGVSYAEEHSEAEGNTFRKAYEETSVHARLNYQYAEMGNVYYGVGQSWFHFPNDRDANQVSWDVGIKHRYSTVTASFESGLTYIPEPLRLLIREDRYIASVSRDTVRTSLAVSGGLREYRNALEKHLETRSYPLQGSFSHALALRTKLLLYLTVNHLTDYLSDTEQTIYHEGARLEHRALEGLRLAVDYRYVNSYSPHVYLQNYYSNRVALEMTLRF